MADEKKATFDAGLIGLPQCLRVGGHGIVDLGHVLEDAVIPHEKNVIDPTNWSAQRRHDIGTEA